MSNLEAAREKYLRDELTADEYEAEVARVLDDGTADDTAPVVLFRPHGGPRRPCL